MQQRRRYDGETDIYRTRPLHLTPFVGLGGRHRNALGYARTQIPAQTSDRIDDYFDRIIARRTSNLGACYLHRSPVWAAKKKEARL